jgi:hypothetical protein
MKQFTAAISIFIFFFLLINSGCKKDPGCGCDSDTQSYLPKTSGELVFNQYKSKWMLSYSPGRGAFKNYFPCNANQDSLKAILQGANQSQSFVVWFSGNVKSPCAGEDFGPATGITSFEYINVDMVSRN